jgi:glycosyltransferase involved in cell wall biosynthesis
VGTVSIVRIVTRLNVGGPTRQIASLMNRLDPARFDQLLVSGEGEAAEQSGLIGVTGRRVLLGDLVRPIAPFRDWRAFRSLVRMLRERRPAIVHTHQGKAGVLGRLAALKAGVPVIVHTYHGHTFRGYFGGLLRPALLAAERRAAACSTALVVQAPEQADDVARHLGTAAAARTRLILPGVEPPERAALGPVADGVTRIVFPARLERVKDPMLMLDVVLLLPPEFRVVVFGDGAVRRSVEARVEGDPRLRGRVEIHELVLDRARLFDGASVTLLTSREEGTPLALIESQWHGVPVVAPDVGALRSVVAPGGGLVVARTARALADGIKAVAGTRLSSDVAPWIERRFGAERFARETAALYEELLAAAP